MSLFNEGPCVHALKMREKGWCLKNITHLVVKMCLSEGKTKHP